VAEADFLRRTRASYDTLAADYAAWIHDELAAKPLDRALLGAFADMVRRAGAGPVADVGCGPGRVTAFLDALGVPAFGIDLSPEMVAVARRSYPGRVALDVHRRQPDRVADLLRAAGFSVRARTVREPDDDGDDPESTPQGYVLARAPLPEASGAAEPQDHA
jgi:SAM-dependent methyltransferase